MSACRIVLVRELDTKMPEVTMSYSPHNLQGLVQYHANTKHKLSWLAQYRPTSWIRTPCACVTGGLGGFDDSLYDDRAGQVPCQRQVQEVNRLPQV